MDKISKNFFNNYSKNKSRSSRYLPENENNENGYKNILTINKIDKNKRSSQNWFAVRNGNSLLPTEVDW